MRFEISDYHFRVIFLCFCWFAHKVLTVPVTTETFLFQHLPVIPHFKYKQLRLWYCWADNDINCASRYKLPWHWTFSSWSALWCDVPFEVDMNVLEKVAQSSRFPPPRLYAISMEDHGLGVWILTQINCFLFYTVFTEYIGEPIYVQFVTEMTMLCRGMLIGTFVSPFRLWWEAFLITKSL
jgi:hypothetical protein